MSFDPGLTSNQSIFTLFPDLCWNTNTVWSLWRLFFGVCPRYIQKISFPCVSGTLLPIKDLFIYFLFLVPGFEFLNAWVVPCCTQAILIPPGSVSSPAWSLRWLLLLWALVSSRAVKHSGSDLEAREAGPIYMHCYQTFTLLTFNPWHRFPEPTHQPLHRLREPHQPPGTLEAPRGPRTALQDHLQPRLWYRCSANSKTPAPLQGTGTRAEGHGDNFTPKGALLTPVGCALRISGLQEYKPKSLPFTCWHGVLWRRLPGFLVIVIFFVRQNC